MMDTCGPNAEALVDPILGEIIYWLGWREGAGKKIQVSFFSDVEMYCHWLLGGNSQPVMKKCFHWQESTSIYMCVNFGQTAEICGFGSSYSRFCLVNPTKGPRSSSGPFSNMRFFFKTLVHTDLSTISGQVAMTIFTTVRADLL